MYWSNDFNYPNHYPLNIHSCSTYDDDTFLVKSKAKLNCPLSLSLQVKLLKSRNQLTPTPVKILVMSWLHSTSYNSKITTWNFNYYRWCINLGWYSNSSTVLSYSIITTFVFSQKMFIMRNTKVTELSTICMMCVVITNYMYAYKAHCTACPVTNLSMISTEIQNEALI